MSKKIMSFIVRILVAVVIMGVSMMSGLYILDIFIDDLGFKSSIAANQELYEMVWYVGIVAVIYYMLQALIKWILKKIDLDF